ncbi:MAG: hypothetical protein ABJX32_00975 [Tateyamaria sp.]|uniref:hypothetical protein n=1 Tax=Tateyamaria sp. TaxID=1929288 RepID=UPI00329B8737
MVSPYHWECGAAKSVNTRFRDLITSLQAVNLKFLGSASIAFAAFRRTKGCAQVRLIILTARAAISAPSRTIPAGRGIGLGVPPSDEPERKQTEAWLKARFHTIALLKLGASRDGFVEMMGG